MDKALNKVGLWMAVAYGLLLLPTLVSALFSLTHGVPWTLIIESVWSGKYAFTNHHAPLAIRLILDGLQYSAIALAGWQFWQGYRLSTTATPEEAATQIRLLWRWFWCFAVILLF